eukprot:1159241-Pelagomonas_calceolata.AAC.9
MPAQAEKEKMKKDKAKEFHATKVRQKSVKEWDLNLGNKGNAQAQHFWAAILCTWCAHGVLVCLVGTTEVCWLVEAQLKRLKQC